MSKYLFSSESVSHAHPDKICDKISDAILDAYLSIDQNVRAGIESFITKDKLFISGEVSSKTEFHDNDIKQIASQTLFNAGYNASDFEITPLLNTQSSDIAQGVDSGGAGDQGIMFGYACNETEQFMPASIYYSHKILEEIFRANEAENINILGNDAKCLLTLEYENGNPIRATDIIVSIQHSEVIKQRAIKDYLIPIIEKTLPSDWLPANDHIRVNPTGLFIKGGPEADAGLTGRKIIVDTYGGHAPHGGGAFSGKDPTKVDRSAAYFARYVAKNIVAQSLADKCLIQVSYGIGIKEPISIYAQSFGTSQYSDKELTKIIKTNFSFYPSDIIEILNLKNPIYSPTAAYGHFGRENYQSGGLDYFTWEKTNHKFK